MTGLVCAAAADTSRGLDITFEPNSNEMLFKNRFAVSYRPGFNIQAKFRNIGAIPPANNPGTTGTDQDHTYDDGYVKRDSATGDGKTWNWGYVNASQVPGNNTIAFHSSQSMGDGSTKGAGDDIHQGFELNYQRYLGHLGAGTWGFDAALNFTDVNLRNKESVITTARRITDVYGLNGVVPPQPPYNGTFTGPGPLISDTPTRTIDNVAGATVTGSHSIDANVYGLHLGAYGSIPLSDRVDLLVSGGFALALIDSTFRYHEAATTVFGPSGSASGQGSATGVRAGAYVGVDGVYHLNDRWDVFVGAQYQYLDSFSQKANGRVAQLDFSGSIFVRAGVGFAF